MITKKASKKVRRLRVVAQGNANEVSKFLSDIQARCAYEIEDNGRKWATSVKATVNISEEVKS